MTNAAIPARSGGKRLWVARAGVLDLSTTLTGSGRPDTAGSYRPAASGHSFFFSFLTTPSPPLYPMEIPRPSSVSHS